MTQADYIERLMAERGLLFDACKEYRATIDRLEKELAEARQTIEDMATGGHQ
jgi:hypothetical protein